MSNEITQAIKNLGVKLMKRIKSLMLAVIITLSMVSCKNASDSPVQTGSIEGTVAPTETVATTETVTTETTVITTAETTAETTTAEAETIDPDAFLAECTVYEVTSEMSSYHAPYKELQKMDDADKPDKVALRFTDIDGLTILMELANETEFDLEYSVRRAVGKDIDISFEPGSLYREGFFYVENAGNITVIENSTLSGKNENKDFYIISGNEYSFIQNDWNNDGYVIEIYEKEDKIMYIKTSIQYYFAVQALYKLMDSYVSDNDFYREDGRIAFENGEAVFVPKSSMTFGEWYQSNTFAYKEYRNKHNAETFKDLIEIYKEYVANGNESEFFDY